MKEGNFVNKETLELFRTLTELQGTSGFEHDVRRFMKEELSKYADEIVQDGLGSVFGLKKGMKMAHAYL